MDIYRANVICWSNPRKDQQVIFITEEALYQYTDSLARELQAEEFLISVEKAEIPTYVMHKFRNWLLFGAGNIDDLDLTWEVREVKTTERENNTMLLKTENFNSWEFNIPVSELVGYVYVADDEDGDFVIMSSIELSDGTAIDVQIIGVSDDMETVTVSTGTNFLWGLHVCTSHESLRSAYLHFITGKVH